MDAKRTIKSLIRLLRSTKVVKANIMLLEPNKRLVGKRIIITGGSRGLGFSMAQKFVAEGAKVLITGCNEKTLQMQQKR
ncbi:MAG: SDR family NAD(P)-dependent oxidoreductase [Bacteroides cellulosilyticus]